MSFPVYPTSQYIERLDTLRNMSYPASPGQSLMHLYQNDVTPDENMTLATFVEADFEGYAAQNVIVTPPTMNDQGLIVAKSGAINFTTGAGAPPQTVYGFYITNNAGDVVIAAQRFDTPQQMGGVYPQAISGVWRTSEPLTTYGWIDVEG